MIRHRGKRHSFERHVNAKKKTKGNGNYQLETKMVSVKSEIYMYKTEIVVNK